MMNKETFKNERIKQAFQIAADGDALIIEWSAKKLGFGVKSNVNFERWLKRFCEQWNNESKPYELDEHIRIFKEFDKKME